MYNFHYVLYKFNTIAIISPKIVITVGSHHRKDKVRRVHNSKQRERDREREPFKFLEYRFSCRISQITISCIITHG